MKRTVIIGFGNLLMSDDGVGIHVVRDLAARSLPTGVEVIDGGVASLETLGAVLDAGRVIIVDALTGEGEPGDIYQLAPADIVPAAPPLAYSLHDFTLGQSIALLARTATLPPLVIYGIEPASLEMGLELTPAVAAAAGRVAEIILKEAGVAADA